MFFIFLHRSALYGDGGSTHKHLAGNGGPRRRMGECHRRARRLFGMDACIVHMVGRVPIRSAGQLLYRHV
jgi:hypothetical protein